MSIFTKELLDTLEDTEYEATEASLVKIRASIGDNNNWLITGWAEKDWLFFGYSCINGVKEYAEWGSIPIADLEDLSKEYPLKISTPNIAFKDAKEKFIG